MFNLSRYFLIMLSLCVYNDLYGFNPFWLFPVLGQKRDERCIIDPKAAWLNWAIFRWPFIFGKYWNYFRQIYALELSFIVVNGHHRKHNLATSTGFFITSLGEATMRRSFSAILLCVVQFKCAIFHYMWTNGETQTNEQSIYLDIYLQCDQMLK